MILNAVLIFLCLFFSSTLLFYFLSLTFFFSKFLGTKYNLENEVSIVNYGFNLRMKFQLTIEASINDKNIGNYGYIDTSILRIYHMSRPKTHFKGMTVISYLKPKGSQWKQHKHSYCNWKEIYQLQNSCSEYVVGQNSKVYEHQFFFFFYKKLTHQLECYCPNNSKSK